MVFGVDSDRPFNDPTLEFKIKEFKDLCDLQHKEIMQLRCALEYYAAGTDPVEALSALRFRENVERKNTIEDIERMVDEAKSNPAEMRYNALGSLAVEWFPYLISEIRRLESK